MKNAEKSTVSRKEIRRTRRFIRRQKAWLNHGRVRPLGILEKFLIRRAGRKDGEWGLPASLDGQVWHSPFLESEVREYQEFSVRMWAQLQLATQGTRAQLRQLTDSHTAEDLLARRAELSAAQEAARHTLDQRKKGEELLTKDQLFSRRQRELQKQLLPLKNQILGLEGKVLREGEEINRLQSVMAELEHSTRLICERMLQRKKQRIAIYWDAAWKAQQQNGAMPPIPEVFFGQEAERRYLEAEEEKEAA